MSLRHLVSALLETCCTLVRHFAIALAFAAVGLLFRPHVGRIPDRRVHSTKALSPKSVVVRGFRAIVRTHAQH